MKQLTIKQACDLLKISRSTFKRRVKSGRYGPGTTSGKQGHPGEVYPNIQLFGLAITRPRCAGAATNRFAVRRRRPCGASVRPDIETVAPVIHKDPDADFAERYLSGEIADSLGNYFKDHRPVSLLGPITFEIDPVELQGHMRPELVAKPREGGEMSAASPTYDERDEDEKTFRTESGQLLAHGYNRAQYERDMRQFQRKFPRVAESRRKQINDCMNIERSFPKP